MVDAHDEVDALGVGHLHDLVGVRPVKDALAGALDVAPAKVHLDPAKPGRRDGLHVTAAHLGAPPGKDLHAILGRVHPQGLGHWHR